MTNLVFSFETISEDQYKAQNVANCIRRAQKKKQFHIFIDVLSGIIEFNQYCLILSTLLLRRISVTKCWTFHITLILRLLHLSGWTLRSFVKCMWLALKVQLSLIYPWYSSIVLKLRNQIHAAVTVFMIEMIGYGFHSVEMKLIFLNHCSKI